MAITPRLSAVARGTLTISQFSVVLPQVRARTVIRTWHKPYHEDSPRPLRPIKATSDTCRALDCRDTRRGIGGNSADR